MKYKQSRSVFTMVTICCDLQIGTVEEQLKQLVLGERYCISRKKEVIQKKY